MSRKEVFLRRGGLSLVGFHVESPESTLLRQGAQRGGSNGGFGGEPNAAEGGPNRIQIPQTSFEKGKESFQKNKNR